MAKFINKKEQVIDFQLTPYGKYLLSTGAFRPFYYAFYDGEILYDITYANSGSSPDSNIAVRENQNNIHNRIKSETSYIEGITCFQELETSPPEKSELIRTTVDEVIAGLTGDVSADSLSELEALFDAASAYVHPISEYRADTGITVTGLISGAERDGELSYFPTDINVRHEVPRKDIYRFGQPIGDARFNGPSQQNAPAWKIAALQGYISSSSPINESWFEERIPQVNVKLTYKKRISNIDDNSQSNPNSPADIIVSTPVFADGNRISLIRDDLLVYAEEVNTEILTENFDVDIFELDVVPQRFSEGKILIRKDASHHPDSGDKITIDDGARTPVTFEFVTAPGDSPSVASNVPVALTIDGSSTTTRKPIENLFKAIEDSELNVKLQPFDRNYLERPFIEGAAAYKPYYVIFIENRTPQLWYESKTNRKILSSFSAGTTAGVVTGFASGSAPREVLHRKYFERTNPQVVDGMMMYGTKPEVETFGTYDPLNLTSASVEYYFDVNTDLSVDRKNACRGMHLFNKDSYYIDLDFECSAEDSCEDDESLYYDIYGQTIGVADIEICEDEIGD